MKRKLKPPADVCEQYPAAFRRCGDEGSSPSEDADSMTSNIAPRMSMQMCAEKAGQETCKIGQTSGKTNAAWWMDQNSLN